MAGNIFLSNQSDHPTVDIGLDPARTRQYSYRGLSQIKLDGAKRDMAELTNEQRDLLLYLGSGDEDDRAVLIDVMHQLRDLGLLYQRESDGNWDLTDEGDEVYGRLAAEQG